MIFHVCTLFPEMIENACATSIFGRGMKAGHIRLDTVNIRDFSINNYNRVDDYPYGGGAGMVMEPEPIFRAVKSVTDGCEKPVRVIYMTPQAEILSQTKVEELAREEELVLLCGRYEGIDERVLQEVVTDYVSIGDYVLTGGELPALVLMDAVARFVPGVLNNEESSQVESLQDNLLEYPQYTRPEVWHGKPVPPVLLTGDHKKITAWRYAASRQRTMERRPDLMKKALQVTAMYTGGETAAKAAALLCDAVSNYGSVMDYNRNKLKKQILKLGPGDLAVFVAEDGEELLSAISRMRPGNTPCAAYLPASATEEEMEALCAGLTAKGFSVIASGFYSEEIDEEEASLLALALRKILWKG